MVNINLSVSDDMIDMLKSFEGLHRKRADGKIEAYLDTNAKPPVWTAGWGHTKTARPGMVLTEEQAVALKKQDLSEHEQNVKDFVTVPLTQGQFDALVSFSYNVGRNNFRKSDVVKAVNAKDFEAAKRNLRKWNRAGGKVLDGLTKRREAEIALFDKKPQPRFSEPIAQYSNQQIQQTITNPNSLWARLRSAVGA